MEDNAETLKRLCDTGREDWEKTKTPLTINTPSVF